MTKPKYILIFLFLLLATQQLDAQTDSCSTVPLDSVSFESQPWFGNNEYLIDLLDSLGYGSGENLNNGGFDSQVKYWIPIRAWVYNDDSGTGGATVQEVEKRIHELNDVFSGRFNLNGNAHPHSMIQFYLACDITYINQSSMAFNCSDNTRQQAWNYNFQQGVMNVHFVQTNNNWGGIARMPDHSQPFVCAIVNGATTTTLAHEMGHNLGLSHTHDTRGSNPINKDANDCIRSQYPEQENKALAA
ncbi:MAG: hypothetical protein MH472_14665 [Bacteroidia bacterium]|nr:hypothetical protein [Bacteroidia bacterium]